MHYVIMCLNSLIGFQKGHFKTLNTLFLTDVVEDEIEGAREAEWTDALCKAKTFETPTECWDLLYRIHGLDFASTNFAVIGVKTAAIEDDRKWRREAATVKQRIHHG